MDTLSKIAAGFIEPVALTGWVLLLLCFLLLRRPGSKAAPRICVLLTIGFFVAGSPWTANALLGVLESRADELATHCGPPAAGSVVVVLAGGLHGLPDRLDSFESMKDATLRRTIAATRLAESVPGSVLLASGGMGDKVREADLMAAFAQALGLPQDRVIAEREARNTFQSVEYAMPLLQRLQGRPLYLVTSAMHMPRAYGVFRSGGLQVCAKPVDYQRVGVGPMEALVPRITAVKKTAEALHEVIGYFGYRAVGRIS